MPGEVLLEINAEPDVAGKPRDWPALATLGTAAFLPARTAERTQHVSLWRAWMIHLLAVGLTAILILLCMDIPDARGWDLPRIWRSSRVMREITREARRHPREFAGIVTGCFVAIEASFVLLAFLVAPWGARVEKFSETLGSAVRRTWLHTSHVFWAIFLLALISMPILRSALSWGYANGHGVYINPPAFPSNPTKAQQEEFRLALEKWRDQSQRARRQFEESKPLHVRYYQELVMIFCLIAGAWFLWALLRAAGARRDGAQIEQPPLCESCGYNLSHTPMEARCPECGELVAESLGPDARPGTAWQHRARLGRVRSYLSTTATAIFHPSSLGRQIRVYETGTDHRFLFGMYCALIGAVATVAPFIFLNTGPGARPFDPWREFIREAGPMGLSFGLGGAGLLLLSAGLTGLIGSLIHRRNLGPAAVQMVSYLGAFVLIGVIIGFATAGVVHAWQRPLRLFMARHHVPMFFDGLVWLVPNLAWVAYVEWALWRGIVAARFANR